MEKLPYQYKKEIVDYCKYLSDKDFMIATDGNISVRIDKCKFLITPKGKEKKNLQPQDLVIIDINGQKIDGVNEPSGEWRLHTTIYAARSDINAVVHTHPVYTTAFSVAGLHLLEPILPEVVVNIDGIPLVEYGTLYTEELAIKIKKYVYDYNAFILKNHGLVTISENLSTAVQNTLKIEHLAKIVFIAKMLGKVDILSEEQVNKLFQLKKIFNKY